MQTVSLMSDPIFLEKEKKNIMGLSSTEFAHIAWWAFKLCYIQKSRVKLFVFLSDIIATNFIFVYFIAVYTPAK